MHAIKRSCSTQTSKRPRLRHLAACLTAALGLSGPVENAIASTVPVSDCTESALRSAVTAANADSSVDTIDMTGLGLSCSTITLASGDLMINGFDMTVLGPTDHTLTIDAAKTGRVFAHAGHGTIAIDHLTMANGKPSGSSTYGGCVTSAGSVRLTHSTVTGCQATYGGGVYAVSSVQVHYSLISSNSAHAHGGGLLVQSGNSIGYAHIYSSTVSYNQTDGQCGGASASNMVVADSTVSDNRAGRCGEVSFDCYGYGGGLCGSSINLNRTSVSGNYAGLSGGGINGGTVTIAQSVVDHNISHDIGGIDANTLQITNSTISGNTQRSTLFPYSSDAGGISCLDLTLYNSTVAFNSNETRLSVNGGVYVANSAHIASSIVARNSAENGGPTPADFYALSGATVSISDSLIMVANVATGSLTADPQLTPLANHGGATRTHALLATSPAVNAGSNPNDLTTDQRGTGFARVVGAKADIGAYERQLNDDEIFYGGFE